MDHVSLQTPGVPSLRDGSLTKTSRSEGAASWSHNLAYCVGVLAGIVLLADQGRALGESASSAGQPNTPPTVELSETQVGSLKIATILQRKFQNARMAVGSVDYNQDRLIQVYTPYQGRIITVFVQTGDRVKAGQTLFTIDSSDLLTAESTLLQTAAVADLTGRNLARAKRLVPVGGGAQKDLDQAISDQQTAEGNLRSAREALHIYGKDEAAIDRLLGDRRIDSTLVVKSPVDGLVTARNGGPGLFVQPGTAPAPVAVADISSKWLVANFAEVDTAQLRRGQTIAARVLAIPDRTFRGPITAIGEAIDPATRRLMVRSEVKDPENILRPGMFANFAVEIGGPFDAVAVPLSGIVREGDGTHTAWVTQDRRHFVQRIVTLGLQQDGYDEILDGVKAGEMVVIDGAIFVSNVLNASPTD